jgi:hypothetical protein
LLLLLGMASAASAAQDPYAAEVPVADDGLEARNAGIRAAFSQVLTQLTGNPDAASRPAAVAVADTAPTLVQQFGYRLEQDPDAGSQRYLRVRFEQRAMDRLVRDLGLGAWRSFSPKLVLWLAQEENGQRALFGLAEAPQVLRTVQQQATRRGIELRVPLLDLQDLGQVSAADVWGGREEQLRSGSRRYGSELVLSGAMLPAGDNWRFRWMLIDGDRVDRFDGPVAELADGIGSGIDAAADVLVSRYAPTGDDGWQSVRVRVLDVATLAQYARLSSYLGEQDAVRDLAVLEASDDELLLQLDVRGGDQVLEQLLSFGGRLEPLPGGEPGERLYRVRTL